MLLRATALAGPHLGRLIQLIRTPCCIAACRTLAADDEAAYPKITMMTTEGEMQFELWNDVAPKHVESFLKLSKQGFFDGGAFHRIIPGFVIQGGDPSE